MTIRYLFTAGAVALGIAGGPSTALAQSDVPIISREVLFGNPNKASPRISPDGHKLSFLAPVGGVLNVWVRVPRRPEAAPRRSCRKIAGTAPRHIVPRSRATSRGRVAEPAPPLPPPATSGRLRNLGQRPLQAAPRSCLPGRESPRLSRKRGVLAGSGGGPGGSRFSAACRSLIVLFERFVGHAP